MLVASHVVVVEIDQGLGGLLHCGHLDQSHFPVPGRQDEALKSGDGGPRRCSFLIPTGKT